MPAVTNAHSRKCSSPNKYVDIGQDLKTKSKNLVDLKNLNAENIINKTWKHSGVQYHLLWG